jgi:GTP pyrophosphokinase
MNTVQTFGCFHHPPTSTQPEELYQILAQQAGTYLHDDAAHDLLARAYLRAAEAHQGIVRDSGEAYITHPLHVALILSCLQLDVATLCAALLHDVIEDTPTTYEGLRQEFGPEVAGLVEGVTKLTKASKVSRAGREAANLQKVYMAMSEDVRVIFIKLADRLHNLRTLHTKRSAQSRLRTATEALEVYARIADRLGIAILRKELEDLAFSYMTAHEYKRVRASIESRYRERQALVDRIQTEVLELLHEHQVHTIDPGVQTNPRRVYDMYRRLQEQMTDTAPLTQQRVPPLLRFHVIVQDARSCYLAMHALHSRWPPIAAEIRDYIWAPLANGYQSLHTTVTIDQHPIKFQIRTTWMHRTSQLGIIAYMQEGEYSAANPALQQTLEDLRRYGTEAAEELSTPIEFITGLKREILADEIYCYTPQNETIRLPVGATPIDFAYHIHTVVGHTCRGALVNGHWTDLNRPLRIGDRVKILTREEQGPCYHWLNPDLGYTESTLAKAKIRRWFRRRSLDQRYQLGKQQVTRLLRRLAVDLEDLTPLAKRLGLASPGDLYDSVGGCDLALERVLDELLLTEGLLPRPGGCEAQPEGLSVIGLGSLQEQFATCCQPHPGDDIVGYILQTQHDVDIHRSDCPTLLAKLDQDRTRRVTVKWGPACETYQATLVIHSLDRPFLLRDVWNIISDEDINVSDVQVEVRRAQDATISIRIDVTDWRQFHRILVRIEDLPGTISVRRQIPSSTDQDTPAAVRQSETTLSTKPPKRPRRAPFSWRFLGG